MKNTPMTHQLDTPVAIIVFKRPKCSQKCMAQIRKVKPRKLYIIADGPREGNPEEASRCAKTRRIVEDLVDWPCEVKKNYSETNMGCGKRIPSGLDWVFEQEESAIIVEGDIVADPSFFYFCEAMLDQYKDDESIMQISGYNRFNSAPLPGNYFHSRYSDFWGWATWRRAWGKFHGTTPEKWEEAKKHNLLQKRCASADEAVMRTFVLDNIMSGKLNAWGMRWEVTKILNGGLGIVPARNLVKNIGFGFNASHTINPFTRHQLIRIRSIEAPYIPCPNGSNPTYDKRYSREVFSGPVLKQIREKLFHLLMRTQDRLRSIPARSRDCSDPRHGTQKATAPQA